MFGASQRVGVAIRLVDGSTVTEEAVVEHLDDGVAVLSPRRQWDHISDSEAGEKFQPQIFLTYAKGSSAEEIRAQVRRWPTRPRAHLSLTDFGWEQEVKRRRFQRVDVALPCTVAHVEGTQFNRFGGRTINVSAGGLLMLLPAEAESKLNVAMIVDIGAKTVCAVVQILGTTRAEPDLASTVAFHKPGEIASDVMSEVRQARVEFTQLSSNDRSSVAAWVLRFDEMRAIEAEAREQARAAGVEYKGSAGNEGVIL